MALDMPLAVRYSLGMKNGEQRKVGNATIVCCVYRGSYYQSRDDAWMGSKMRPRCHYSHTRYLVVGSDGKAIGSGVEGYRAAVKVALAAK